MNKKKSQTFSDQDQSEKSLPKFLDVESKIFTQVRSDIYIGRDKIDPAIRSLLQDEAAYIQKSRLWEILNASIINEAYNLALLQSKDWDNVQFAKAMKHFSVFIMKVLSILEQK